ncbi:MAG: hypothetical protein HZA14_11955 [Nitrospirae bacterium]|nr:hypothetical protein [Nitrospirota bacterium]
MQVLGNFLFLAVSCYFTGVLCLFLALLVLKANPGSKGCRLAFALNLFVSLWAFAFGSMLLSKNEAWGLLIAKILTVAIYFINASFFHLVMFITHKEKSFRKCLIANYALACCLALITLLTRLIIQGSPPKLDFPSYLEGGPLYFISPVYLFLVVSLSIFSLIGGIRRAKGYQKTRLALFLASSSLGYLAGIPTYLMAYNIPIKPLALPFVSLFPIILSYAIIKHRFLDIRKLVKNTLLFSLLFILLLCFASGILFITREIMSRWVGLDNGLAQAIAIALALALYSPLKEGLSRITRQILYLHAENPETIFGKLSENMLHYLDTKTLAQEATKRVRDTLALHRISLYLRNKRNPYVFEPKACIGRIRKKTLSHTNPLIQYLERTKEFLAAPHGQKERPGFFRKKPLFALRNIKEIKNEAIRQLAILGGVGCFPVFINQSLRGVLIIGQKKSDASFREDEFEILKSFTRHFELALGNAEYAEGLRRSHEELSRNERDAFAGALIAGVEHEAKNPVSIMTLSLTNLKTNASLLSGSKDEAERRIQKTMLDVLEASARIKGIIEHLSTLADKKPLRIEANVQPHRIAMRAIQDLAQNGNGNGHKVRMESRIPENLRLACDSNALFEILINLIRNGQEACPKNGSVILSAQEHETEVILRIKDTGSGIPSAHFDHIFEPFYTTKNSRQNGKPSGSGMGLFIVKENMESMGAKIEVRSRLGKGTVFRLRFPSLAPAFEGASQ